MTNPVSSTQSATTGSSTKLAVTILLVVNALWGLSFPIVKSLTQFLDMQLEIEAAEATLRYRSTLAGWIIATRFTIAFILIAIFWRKLFNDASRAEWKAGFWIGVFFFLGLILQIFGLAMIPASRSGFLTSLTTIFTPLIALAIYRQLPTWNIIAGCLLALVGVSFLTGLIEWNSSGIAIASDALSRWTLGDSLTTLGAFFFSFQVLFVDYFGKRLNAAAITPGMFLTTAIAGWLTVLILTLLPSTDLIQPQLSISELCRVSWHPAFLTSIAVLALVCSIFTFGWMNQYQPFVSAVQAAVIYSFEPVFASMWALFIPGLLTLTGWFAIQNEVLTPSLVGGGLLILFANAVALWRR
jgi:drug/metabolite transporter (DMT)-like permease